MKMIDTFLPIFEYIGELASELVDESNKTIDDVHEDLKPLFKTVSDGTDTLKGTDLALFAICAFIDEKILASDWKDKEKWSKKPLQKIYFDTNKAGELFFSKLDELNENIDEQQQVREVYLYCLVQGFSGCYFSLGEQSLLQELIQSNYALLATDTYLPTFDTTANTALSPPIDEQAFRQQLKEIMTIWGPISLVIITYLFLRNDLLDTITSALSQI